MPGSSEPTVVRSETRAPRLGLTLMLLAALAGCVPLAAAVTLWSVRAEPGTVPHPALWPAALGLAVLVPIVLLALFLGRRLSRDIGAVRGGLDTLASSGASDGIETRTAATREVSEAFNRAARSWAVSREETSRAVTETTRLNSVITAGMKEPLREIRVGADRLRRHMPGRSALNVVESMLREAERMEATLRRVMLYARPPRLRQEVIGVNAAVDVCVRAMQPFAARTGQSLTFDPDPNVDRSRVDPDLFHQMLVSLVVNALEASGPGGQVSLRTQALGDQVLVAVRDDGPGLPLEELDAIFQPFYTSKKHSAGLGLAIARRIAEAHHGSITAMNVHPHGLEVGVRLGVVVPPISTGWRRTLSGRTRPTSPWTS